MNAPADDHDGPDRPLPPMLRLTDGRIRQAAAVPMRWRGDEIDVLLIRRTDRRRIRWRIPKGLVDPGLDERAAATLEAWEEAGVRGRALLPSIGAWEHAKFGGVCVVETFAFVVESESEAWPECDQRARAWFALEEAIGRLPAATVGRLVRAAGRRFEAEP